MRDMHALAERKNADMRKLNHLEKGTSFFVKFGSVVLSGLIAATVFTSLTLPSEPVKAAKVKTVKTGASADYTVNTIGNTASNIYWNNATYYDYLSDTELSKGWLNADQSGTGFNGSSDDWYPFKSLNSTISSIAGNNSSWSKPLYFGNYCNTNGSYIGSTHNGVTNINGVTRDNIFNSFITPQVNRFDYAANNSNGLNDLHQSYPNLMQSSLTNSNLMATSSLPAPYFNASSLGNKVRTVNSFFPFRTTKSKGGTGKTTYYEFNSNDATDNVYFTWTSTGASGSNDLVKPTAVNYGAGKTYGVEDGLKYFMNPDDTYVETGAPYKDNKYYGIFPFNNRKNNGDNKTSAYNTRYIYASKGETGWNDIYCYFFDNSNNPVGASYPGTKMEAYYEGDNNNRRIKIPDGATKFILSNGSTGGMNQTDDLTDLSWGAYTLEGSTKYVYLSKDNTGWSDGDTMCYFFNDSGTVGSSWPGYNMQSYDGSSNVRVAVPAGAKYCIFSKRNSSDQTGNVTLQGSKCAFWLGNDRSVHEWTDAPSDAGISSSSVSVRNWDSKPIDAGKASPGSEALDYGFGIRMDMKFRVPSGGYDDDNKPVEFNYSGDDDLWVYLTDRNGNSKLVLDLGGNHKKATGKISFVPKSTNGSIATCTATASNAYGKGDNYTTDFTFDYSQTYTMSIFYMERGMFESNCRMSFSLTLPENNVLIDKTVDSADVNSGIADSSRFKSLLSSERFNFTAYQNDAAKTNTEYSLNDPVSGITDGLKTDASSGVFRLKDKQSADFPNKFTTGANVYVKEAYDSSNKLSYDTSWTVKDIVNNNTVLGSTSSLTGGDKQTYAMRTKNYPLIDTTAGADVGDYAELQYSFENSVKTAPLTITKTVKDYRGNDITSTSELKDDTFSAKVEIDLKDGNGYKTYDLAYSDTDGNSGSGSTVTLKHGRTVTIEGIPVGANYRVTETVPAKYTNSNSVVTGTITSTGGAVGFVNTEKAPDSASAVIKAKKLLKDDKGNNVSFTDGSFEFELYSGTTLIQTKSVSGSTKEVSFNAINYTDVGTHSYTIKEKQVSGDGMITYDTKSCPVTVTVTKNGSTLSAAVSYSGTTSESTPPTFNNVVKTGSVVINKSNQAGGKLSNVTFTVYKVTKATADADSSYDTVTSTGTAVDDYITNTDGKVTISGLPVYNNNSYDSDNPTYQYYALLEKSTGDDNYRLNRVVNYFCFDNSNDLTRTYSYLNGHLRNPKTAGDGVLAVVKTGLLFIGLSGISLLIYYVIKRPRKKKLAHLRA